MSIDKEISEACELLGVKAVNFGMLLEEIKRLKKIEGDLRYKIYSIKGALN